MCVCVFVCLCVCEEDGFMLATDIGKADILYSVCVCVCVCFCVYVRKMDLCYLQI